MFSFLRLTLTGREVHVETNNITWGKLPVFDLLSGSLLVNNNIVTVNKMLFDSVRKNSLNRVAVKLFCCLSDGLGDLLVGASFSNLSESSLESVVGSLNNVCFATGGFAFSDVDGSRCVRGKSVDVSSANDLCDVSLSERRGLGNKRRVMTHDVVN